MPCPETQLFRYAATRPVLNLLAENRYDRFALRDLERATDHSLDNVRHAVSTLEAVGLVQVTTQGNRKLVQIDRSSLTETSDPITRIPQPEFHQPVRAAVRRLKDELDDVRGAVLFGSVARGEADRRSDVDLFVLVGDRQAANQRKAHELGEELGEERFEGERYRFQIMVESVETAGNYGERLRDILAEGLTLYGSETLRDLRTEVISGGR